MKNKWGEEKKCDQCGDAYGKNMPAGKVPNVQKFLDAMMDHDDRYLNSEQVQHKIRGALIEDDVSFRNSQKRVIREKQLRDFFQHGLLPNTGTHVLMHNPHLHVKGTWNGIESAAPGAFNTEALMLMRKKAIDSCVQFSNKELEQAQ